MHFYKSLQLILCRFQIGLVFVFLCFQVFDICLQFWNDLLSVLLELAFSLFDLLVEGDVALFGGLQVPLVVVNFVLKIIPFSLQSRLEFFELYFYLSKSLLFLIQYLLK